MAEKLKIYFLGSGAIAVNTLNTLSAAPEIELVGVGTQLDKPAGRSRKLTPTPVAAAAKQLGIPVEKLASVNAPDFLSSLRERKVDMIVLIAFGQLLRDEILHLPRFGCINIHASLLPKYRGASPIASAILAGEKKTGITVMRMVKGLDAGPVYCRFEYPLEHEEGYRLLEQILARMSARSIVEVIGKIASGELIAQEQDESCATVCTKIRKGDGAIYWLNPASYIAGKVRAYEAWPTANTILHLPDGRELRLALNTVRVRPELSGQPGEVVRAGKKELVIACGEGALEIVTLTVAGKREMSASALLNGYKLDGAFAELKSGNY